MTQVVIFGLMVKARMVKLFSTCEIARINGGIATSTNKFKEITSITFKNGNGESAAAQASW